MPMYEPRAPLPPGRETQELLQGDILEGVLVPAPLTAASFGIRENSTWKWTKPQLETRKVLEAEAAGTLRAMTKPERKRVIVVSNSCDNDAGSYQIALAPISDFEFSSQPEVEVRDQLRDLVEVLTPHCSTCDRLALRTVADGRHVCDDCAPDDALEIANAPALRAAMAGMLTAEASARLRDALHWVEISRAATGFSKYFYLPANLEHGFPRSEVSLPEMFSVEPSYVTRCLVDFGGKRLFGLTDEAARHLQRTVEFHFSRNPRDDYQWPSSADLELKAVWLEEEIQRGGPRVAQYRLALQKVRGILQK